MDIRRRRSSGALALDPAGILREHPIDPAVAEGARNGLRTCLGVEPGQRVVLVIEPDRDELAAAFLQEAEAIGAIVEVHIADARKATFDSFVSHIQRELAGADASLFVGTLEGLPAAFRYAIVHAGGERRRHGHMPGLTAAMMQQSMRTDYLEVKALSERLLAKVRGAATIAVHAPRGTNLVIRAHANRWHAEHGVLREAGWTNLPAGELLTCPDAVDGVLVPDGGAWDAEGQPVKNADRLRLTFEGGRVTQIEGGAGSEPQMLTDQLGAHEHADRVGQIGFGTNVGVVAAVGNLLQDLKMPGFHVVLGHTSPELTGADWNAAVEIPMLVRRADVDVDGTPVLRGGRYVVPWVE